MFFRGCPVGDVSLAETRGSGGATVLELGEAASGARSAAAGAATAAGAREAWSVG